eukprot:6197534-Prymnesium_polylepis.3
MTGSKTTVVDGKQRQVRVLRGAWGELHRHQVQRERGCAHVAIVEKASGETREVELRVRVDRRVEVQVDACKARVVEGSPPPAVVLAAELEVAHDDAHLWATRPAHGTWCGGRARRKPQACAGWAARASAQTSAVMRIMRRRKPKTK